MAPPNTVDLTSLAPALSRIASPIADLLKLDINGVVSGIGMVQNHAVSGDFTDQVDISNAEIILQKPDGVIQYYLQVGGYSIPSLGTAYLNMGHSVNALYGLLPVAYLKIAPTGSFSIMAGNLLSLFGAEYPFTFENVNIERGMLLNQTSVINRGVQLNFGTGPFSAALSWNDGFYSRSYTWLSASLGYAINSANTLTFVGGGNLGFAKSSNLATPLLNDNGQIYDIFYEYDAAPWIVEPWFQWTVVPHNPNIGVFETTSTISGAILASYALTERFFLAGRWEFIGTTGSSANGAADLLYGPGSQAWSLTLTPTYQYKRFFVRGEASLVQAMSYKPGAVFGNHGRNPAQIRGVFETGLFF